MKILFCDTNKSLVEKVRVAAKQLPKGTVRCYTDSVFNHKGVYVSASNPIFSMVGGLDAQIAKNFKKECSQIDVRKGNQRIGNVCFTITVDRRLNAKSNLVRSALRFAIKNTKNETLIVSGLGTGIGGLDENEFVRLFIQAIKFNLSSNTLGRPKKQTELTLRWKFLRTGLVSDFDKKTVWKIGDWKTTNGNINLCSNGFHCSKTILQALGYIKGEVLAQVECSGKSDVGSDKEAYSSMRVIKAYEWDKEFSVKLAIFAAKKVLEIYESKYPNDYRPRKAIETAKVWLKNPSDKNSADAAYAADAAFAADAAAYAADAAYAARAAAHAADAAYAAHAAYAARAADAAGYAAYAARAARAADAAGYAAHAARAAAYAAFAAAKKELVEQINSWIESHLHELKEIK